jgi:arylsulfatase A-like enzyme
MMILRGVNWKYVQYANQPMGELYDLGDDPDEYENLWERQSRRGLRDECRDRLMARMMNDWDPLPERKYNW